MLLKDGSIFVAASATTPPQMLRLNITGIACTAVACGQGIKLAVGVTVVPLAAPPGNLDDFSSPSPDRLAAAIPVLASGSVLSDELLVTVGTAGAPGDRATAEAAASAAGGVVSGGLYELGVYEIRWAQPQDTAARRAQLLAQPGVTEASSSYAGLVEEDAEPPGDWGDDGPQATWPFAQVGARAAWDVTQGTSVMVGVVDGGVALPNHEDLNIVKNLGGGSPDSHATHVAGLACARANGIGLVGMAWGCPIVTRGRGDGSDKAILEAAYDVSKQPGIGVINMSLGYRRREGGCHAERQQAELLELAQNFKGPFRRLFTGQQGRRIVWTIAAGNNCAAGVPSPWGANADLDNVITVAATNSDATLARFSDFGPGVEVAAPGGVSVSPIGGGTVGIWSTSLQRCGLLNLFRCSSYEPRAGTSMAAPIVAGIAALVRAAHPGYAAPTVAACITETAGRGGRVVTTRSPFPLGDAPKVDYAPTTLRLVSAEAAVACSTIDPLDKRNYVGRWDNGAWTLDFAEESAGVLGAVNQAPTSYPACTEPAGTKIFSAFVPDPSGQWNGDVLASDCVTRIWSSSASMRVIGNDASASTLVLAWATDTGGPRPNIDANGLITSAGSYYSAWLSRQPQLLPFVAASSLSLWRLTERPGPMALLAPPAPGSQR